MEKSLRVAINRNGEIRTISNEENTTDTFIVDIIAEDGAVEFLVIKDEDNRFTGLNFEEGR